MPIDHADEEHFRRVGLDAVAAVARRQGLPADDLRVVSDRGNLLVHLAPAPVVARAATRTGWTRRDPAAWLAREVAVCAHVAARGGPVGAPAPLADPGPHRVGPVTLTLWEYRPPQPERAAGPELGEMLAALHDAAVDFPGALPWLAPARDQVTDTLHVLARRQLLPAATLAALQERHSRALHELEQVGSAPVVLHGDAHRGNLLRDDRGWFWVDLEETCLGPPEWDLAVLDDPTPSRPMPPVSAGPGRRRPNWLLSVEPVTSKRRCGWPRWHTCTRRATGQRQTGSWRRCSVGDLRDPATVRHTSPSWRAVCPPPQRRWKIV